MNDAPIDLDRLETLARELEASPDFRILRRFKPHAHWPRRGPDGSDSEGGGDATTHVGVIVDCETTGLALARDEVIELAMVRFANTTEGRNLRVLATVNGLRQPGQPIPPDIVGLTGITDELVKGRSIDPALVDDFVAGAHIVIAHNARFDRPMLETLWPVFGDLDWACSLSQISWSAHGASGLRLSELLARHGLFFDAHRALDDSLALLHLLSLPLEPGRGPALASLIAAAREPTVRLFAREAPYEAKDRLKQRGYRWSNGLDGDPRSWWRDLAPAQLNPELEYLGEHVYPGRAMTLPTRAITARLRFSSRRSP